jgi:hypothetical protein
MRYHWSVVDSRYRVGGQLALAYVMCCGLLSGCFAPDVHEGLACSASGSCPIGQVCVDLVCIQAGGGLGPGFEPDASRVVGDSDAASGDADTGCASDTVKCGDVCLAECQSEFSLAGESTYQPEEGCNYLRVHAWGAGGGHGNNTTNAGAGGYALIERAVTSAETYTVVVGAPGTSAVGGTAGMGGVPGGGGGGTGSSDGGGGGGGYSGLFSGGTAAANALVIAGGGGGSGGGNGFPANTNAGAGGGLSGQVGSIEGNSDGGTQSTGFAPLLGGPGGSDTDGGGGGGGGWYGGQGGEGVGSDDAQGAGGGSGYVGTSTISELVAGVRGIAGNPDSTLRGTGGDPTLAGKVVLICYPAQPVL